MKRHIGLAVCLAFVVNVGVKADNDDTTNDQCTLYMATSSTSTADEPKWGLYAGKGGFSSKERIGYGDVAIHTHQMQANAFSGDDNQDFLTNIVDFFENFIWVPHPVGGQYEMEDGKVVTAIPGGGSLSGFNPKMTNADWNHSMAYHRPAWNEYPKRAHPGRGAYSNFYEASIYSTDDIPEGMEILISYGENYEEENAPEEEQLSKADLQKVDLTIDKIMEFFQKHEAELDATTKHEVYQFLIRDVMQAAAGSSKGSKIMQALPDSPDELYKIKEAGGMLDFSQPTMIRTLNWLETHGRCMDNIQPGPSTIPYAGRGAFATRDLNQNARIAPSPMIQISDKEVMKMYLVKEQYDAAEEEHIQVRDGQVVVGSQLLLNYCFGHPDSRMLLFPTGAGVAFINHSKEPNAKLMWSDHPNHHAHWLDLPPEELINDQNNYLGLLMEVVAIKDIKQGEEIFIDYGTEWQEAWDDHVLDWERKQKRGKLPKKWPVRALDLNKEYTTKPFNPKTKIPDNIFCKCFLVITKTQGDEPDVNENGDRLRVWTKHRSKETFDSANLFNCKLLTQDGKDENGTYTYTIEWESAKDNGKTIVKSVPHDAIVFVDKPNTGDQFTPDGFRHSINIPDDIFPQGNWRNAGNEEEEESESSDE